jgi:acetyl esterase/lipase
MMGLGAAEEASAPLITKDVSYRSSAVPQTYEAERCKLNLVTPVGKSGFATYVWFYGGALKAGSKDLASEHCLEIAEAFAREGVAVVTPDYRLSPKVNYPAYVDDAAASFAWTVKNIAKFGGDPKKVFIGGHSAGGYLALLVGFDAKRLEPYGLGLADVAGIAQVSGQVFTHYTIREERGISRYVTIADEAAPSFYVRRTLPPLLSIYADNDMVGRAEENQYLVAMLKSAGHTETYSLKVADRDHGSVGHGLRNAEDPAHRAVLNFIQKISATR